MLCGVDVPARTRLPCRPLCPKVPPRRAELRTPPGAPPRPTLRRPPPARGPDRTPPPAPDLAGPDRMPPRLPVAPPRAAPPPRPPPPPRLPPPEPPLCASANGINDAARMTIAAFFHNRLLASISHPRGLSAAHIDTCMSADLCTYFNGGWCGHKKSRGAFCFRDSQCLRPAQALRFYRDIGLARNDSGQRAGILSHHNRVTSRFNVSALRTRSTFPSA